MPALPAQAVPKRTAGRQPESNRQRTDSKTCSFHASTLVKTQTGYKTIADIKVGNKVLNTRPAKSALCVPISFRVGYIMPLFLRFQAA